jgi:hypothetical protein
VRPLTGMTSPVSAGFPTSCGLNWRTMLKNTFVADNALGILARSKRLLMETPEPKSNTIGEVWRITVCASSPKTADNTVAPPI